MNKKIVAFIIVILISFCFLGIVVADNAIHDDKNSADHDKTIDKDKADKNKPTDKNKTTHKNKTDDKSKKNYILAKGSGNDIKFSDGFRGFILDYSKSPAKSGDEFKRASASAASNSNSLKLAIIECYKLGSGNVGKVVADFVKSGSSGSKVGEAVAASHRSVGDHEVVKIDNHTEAVFDFEVLKSVSGNESDYFAYTVSFRTINEEVNQTNNLTNVTNTTNITANVTNLTQPIDNQTNSTFLKNLYDYLAALANSLYGAWKPIVDTLLNSVLMMVDAIEKLVNMFEDYMMELQSLMDAFNELLKMLESIWNELDGLLKLLGVLMTLIQQILNLIGAILNFIIQLISAIIALIEQLIGLLLSLLEFLLALIDQIIALIQAILDFLKSLGSFLINVIENAVIIIASFAIITVAAFIYNRIR